ncbi:unnamed protein product [Lactuca saligna]|uniref:Uncharacterized protein n=1 Tax=Lactuca saligna TaxID=75948 RepID=A0AA36ELE6_LACSI|nr:unnamed protein product [Lactuca saligna]
MSPHLTLLNVSCIRGHSKVDAYCIFSSTNSCQDSRYPCEDEPYTRSLIAIIFNTTKSFISRHFQHTLPIDPPYHHHHTISQVYTTISSASPLFILRQFIKLIIQVLWHLNSCFNASPKMVSVTLFNGFLGGVENPGIE